MSGGEMMLVLTRKRSEIIQIGEDIFIKVIRTGRSTVKIGVEAPSNVRVLRGELCEDTVVASKGDTIELAGRVASYDDAEPVCSDQFPHPRLIESVLIKPASGER
jgi:carbon storage regulator